jgi:hypothetical protein
MKARDPDAAEQAMRSHLRHALLSMQGDAASEAVEAPKRKKTPSAAILKRAPAR